MRLCITLVLIHCASISYGGVMEQTQRMLNELEYNAGRVDGIFGKKTKNLKKLRQVLGSFFDGKLHESGNSDLLK